MGTVRKVSMAPDVRALSTLPRVDYEDAFRVQTGPNQARTGEQWARAILEAAPIHMRRSLRWGWFTLGLKVGGLRSDQRVLGWEVRCRAPDYLLLGAGSRIGMPAELLFKPEPDTLLFATFVQQRNPLAGAVWAAVERQHQRVVPYLLGRAAGV